MPRPRQRQGAEAKRDQKKAKRDKEEEKQRAEEAEAKRERYRKKEMDYPSLPTSRNKTTTVADLLPDGTTTAEEAVIDENAIPEPDPDTKAYFKQVADKIRELEELASTKSSRAKTALMASENPMDEMMPTGEEEEEEIEDDRPLLLRSSLESLSGHEMTLAGDPDTSIILERLLFAMDDFAKRVLGDRFAGQFERLAKHRNGSHVLQTLLSLAGETIDRETRGIIAAPPSASTSTLPTMTAIVLSALTELLPSLSTLIYDPFGSHTVRILLLIFAGQAPLSEGDKSRSAERSKKSQNWRGRQGAMKNFLGSTAASSSSATGGAEGKRMKRKIPKEFKAGIERIVIALNELDDGGPAGEGIRRAAMDDIAGPVIRILIELESSSKGGWKSGGWADRVLYGLVDELAVTGDEVKRDEKRVEARLEYLSGLLRHPASSPTFETLLELAPAPLFSALWESLFHTRLARLAGHTVGNFVVAKGLSRVNEGELKNAVDELMKIGRERRGEWIDNSRTGVFRSLLERATVLKSSENEVVEMLLDSFQLDTPEDQKAYLIPCILSLNRLEHYKKLPSHLTATPSTQGSVLLQTWLRLNSPNQKVLVDAILSLPLESLTLHSRSPTSSHILDAFLSSPTTLPSSKRAFLLALIGQYHTLADDRIGSHFIEHCWASADMYLKEKIALSLVSEIVFLQRSAWARYWSRSLELPLLGRKPNEWRMKMRLNGMSAEERTKEEKRVEEEKRGARVEKKKRRRERKVDEIDELFAAGGGAPKRVKVDDEADKYEEEVEAVEAGAMVEVKKLSVDGDDGLRAVMNALKASA